MGRKNKHDQMYYMKKCRDALEAIQRLSPDDGMAFLRLKKKAAKYLAKAREFEKKQES